MGESISFWLENRNCAGTRVAVIGSQSLVLYRDRYYIVAEGAAQARRGKPLRFSTTSLPTLWKHALKGDVPPPLQTTAEPATEFSAALKKRGRKIPEEGAMADISDTVTTEKHDPSPLLNSKTRRKGETNPSAQLPVVANCPYCNSRHDIPVEKGKSGKPFFMACSKCTREFAVRFVQVTMFQAQVAGFR